MTCSIKSGKSKKPVHIEKMRSRAFFLVLLILSTFACKSAPPVHETASMAAPESPKQPQNQLVVVSWDGFRPEFYSSTRYKTPHLRALIHRGAHATGLVPVYPTLTYPNHTTMITGVLPKRHGVISNTIFNWDNGPTQDWYWNASFIQVPTLWQRARESDLKTAALGWPVSVGAPVDWLVPEIFSTGTGPDVWELTRRNMQGGLVQELSNDTTIQGFTDDEQHDHWMTEAALSILKRHAPNLLLLHLTQGDHAQHQTGRDSEATQKAVEHLDSWIGKIADSLDLNRTTLIVLGDHGFKDYTRELRLNSLLREKGWITVENGRVSDWKAIAHPGGGGAVIYVRDKAMNAKVMRFLREHSKGRYMIVPRSRLDKLGAYPEALCAIEPVEGVSFSGKFDGPLLGPPLSHGAKRGNHGYLPSQSKLFSGFIAVGPGIRPGKDLGVIRMIDVGPTLADALKIKLPSAQGKAINLK